MATQLTDALLRKKVVREQWVSQATPRSTGQLVARLRTDSARFYFRYSDAGKDRCVPIGRYSRDGDGESSFTLAQASDRARELRAVRTRHPDLRAYLQREQLIQEAVQLAEIERIESERQRKLDEAQALSRRVRVSTLFERFAEIHLARREDGGAYTRRAFAKDVLPALGGVAVADVTRADISGLLDGMVQTRGVKRMAQLLLSDLKLMFSFAVKRGFIEHSPVDLLATSDYGARNMRDRNLSITELRSLADRINDAGLTAAATHFILLALATGARTGELIHLKREDVNLADRTLLLRNTKNGTDHVVALSQFAADLLASQSQQAHPSEFVFPSRNGKTHINVKTFGKQVDDRQAATRPKRLSGRTKRSDALVLSGGKWTPHDLRRTAGTLMVEHCGVPAEVANRCLNHLPKDPMIRTYIRATYGKQMEAAWHSLGQLLGDLFPCAKAPFNSSACAA